MNFIKQMERIEKMYFSNRSEKTDTPDGFTRKLQLSRSQLYYELVAIKNLDAPIKDSRKEEFFYYDDPYYLKLNYALNIVVEDESQEIFSSFNFCAS